MRLKEDWSDMPHASTLLEAVLFERDVAAKRCEVAKTSLFRRTRDDESNENGPDSRA